MGHAPTPFRLLQFSTCSPGFKQRVIQLRLGPFQGMNVLKHASPDALSLQRDPALVQAFMFRHCGRRGKGVRE